MRIIVPASLIQQIFPVTTGSPVGSRSTYLFCYRCLVDVPIIFVWFTSYCSAVRSLEIQEWFRAGLPMNKYEKSRREVLYASGAVLVRNGRRKAFRLEDGRNFVTSKPPALKGLIAHPAQRKVSDHDTEREANIRWIAIAGRASISAPLA
jgi:hypothetical protein